jgi:phosphate:Na+ symporter
VAGLNRAIAAFIVELNRSGMSSTSARKLPELLRVARYYERAVELVTEAAQAGSEIAAAVAESGESVEQAEFREQAKQLLIHLDPGSNATERASAQRNAEASYQALKAALLEAGAQGRLPVDVMDARLRVASAHRRALEQAGKAATLLNAQDGNGSS